MIQKIVKDTEGNVITERPIGEIEIIRPPFRCIIKRDGQEDAEKGNRVVVRCLVLILANSKIHKFKSYLWGRNAFYWHNRVHIINNFITKTFCDITWGGAFALAEKYFNDECDKYEHLLFEREQALKNAE